MEASGAPFVRPPLKSAKKYKHTTSTAALFRKRNFEPKPSKLSSGTTITSSSPTKHNRSRGINKRQLKLNTTRTLQEVEVAQRKPSALSVQFNEVTQAYRQAVVTDADALLHSARQALLTRLNDNNNNDDDDDKLGTPVRRNPPTVLRPFIAAIPDNENNDAIQRRKPTLRDLCRSHNAEVAYLQDALPDEEVEYDAQPERGLAGETRRVGDAMEQFRRVVADEAENLARLEAEWDAVDDEIVGLARRILEDATPSASRAVVAGRPGDRKRRHVVDAAVGQRLRQKVREAADQFDRRVGEVREAERTLERRQERFLADTIRSMGDL